MKNHRVVRSVHTNHDDADDIGWIIEKTDVCGGEVGSLNLLETAFDQNVKESLQQAIAARDIGVDIVVDEEEGDLKPSRPSEVPESGSTLSPPHERHEGLPTEELPKMDTAADGSSPARSASAETLGQLSRASSRLRASTKSQLLKDSWTGDPWMLSTRRSFAPLPWPIHMLVVLILLVAVGGVLGAAGVLFSSLFASADWHGEHRHRIIVLLILGSIFTGWNIAQYASLTIQTTGHLTPMQHFRSLKKHGMYIVGPCLTGWSFAFLSAFALPSGGIVFHALLVLVPSIGVGIFTKTYCKLKYIYDRSQGQGGYFEGDKNDCLYGKAARNVDFGETSNCPFTGIKSRLVLSAAMKPCLCFVWTVLYAVAFRLLILASKNLPGGLEGWQQRVALCSIFACVFVSEEVGGSRLMDLMDNATGIMAYPSRMSVAFCLIYDMVSESFVNLTVVNADEALRTAFSFVRPVMEVGLRMRFALEYRKMFRDMQKMDDSGEYTVDFVRQDAKVMRRLIAVGSGLLNNVVVPILMSACACAFNAESGLDMQAGCEDGVIAASIGDVGPGLAIMSVELLFYCGCIRMPILQYFLFLDPFLVVCAIVVVYVLIALVALTSVINLDTAFGITFQGYFLSSS
eukprot:TRINITY_DN9020_c0_g1_i1.p1 TRINITY_DN9020_c0_g1~~TRINITY_DN9020_c0_g1_i1.p1  ORF type:complete len:629 (-),score=112.21 TRINITY_DN9020_c0_g1_i1:65-1951(-)